MQSQNKLNGHIFQLDVYNYQGAEVVELDMSDGLPKILCGPNGQGKSSTIKALYEALGGKLMLPEKVDNSVGPYGDPSKVVKKALVKIGIEGDPGILELKGHSLEKFYVNFSVTEKGSVNLSVTDAKDPEAKPVSAPREKIKNLLGLFLDPVDMVKTLEESRGDSKLAEKLCVMSGHNPVPFNLKEEVLFKERQEEYVTLKNEKGEFAKLDMPQPDWAKLYVDPVSISSELQKFNEFNTKEEEKKRRIEEAQKELGHTELENKNLDNEVEATTGDLSSAEDSYNLENKNLDTMHSNFAIFKEQNKPEGWDSSESVDRLEKQIAELNIKLKSFRDYDQSITGKTNDIEIKKQGIQSLYKAYTEKVEIRDNKVDQKSKHDEVLLTKSENIKKVSEDNKPIEWTGEKDPEGIKTPLQFLTEKMSTVERDNDQVKNAKKYYEDEEGIKLTEQSIKDIDAKRKQNQNDKAAQIAQVKDKFPHPGITIDYKKPFNPEDDSSKQDITVWVDFDDGLGKRTINDISEGQKLFICTHILIAGNTGALNILVIRSGHALDEDNQKIIFDIAKQYGYHVILETIISTFKGAFNIRQGNIASINTEGREIETVEKSIEEIETEINW